MLGKPHERVKLWFSPILRHMSSHEPSSQIERVPLHEEVTNRLRDMIVSLRLRPGERIQELEVAQWSLMRASAPARPARKKWMRCWRCTGK